MQIKRTDLSKTTTKLVITLDKPEIDSVKSDVVSRLSKNIKLQGFRAGHVPPAMAEKAIDPSTLQTEFLEAIVNQSYSRALSEEKLRPAAEPTIAILKFVPYETLEFSAELEAILSIKLPNYRNLGILRPKVTVTAAEVTQVLHDLQSRSAAKKEVQRAAKIGDEVVIDFKGVDEATDELIEGASGTAVPLELGSKSFIPGFEEALVGAKPKETVSFSITFPKDYGMADLRNKKAKFAVTVRTVASVTKPKLDDAFAATVGPFSTLALLKADIKKQLQLEKESQSDRAYENELLEEIAHKADFTLPEAFIDQEIDRMEVEEKRNLVYRGQTWTEHLQAEGVTEAEHRLKNHDAAELRMKAGVVLAEIADTEQITISTTELETRLQQLKKQYESDATMLAELDKPEGKRDILSRLLTEKTLERIKSLQQPTTKK